ncbi:hypothetical protein HG530_010251 [Fusarium avenaceum]|nr:hypothetical protein HG530_010251 [Fusarium avenaceum]
MSQPKFSAGTDAANVTPALNALLTSKGGRWTLAKDGTALERQFKFKTFAKTWPVSQTKTSPWLPNATFLQNI